jgi:hypothetical protein
MSAPGCASSAAVACDAVEEAQSGVSQRRRVAAVLPREAKQNVCELDARSLYAGAVAIPRRQSCPGVIECLEENLERVGPIGRALDKPPGFHQPCPSIFKGPSMRRARVSVRSRAAFDHLISPPLKSKKVLFFINGLVANFARLSVFSQLRSLQQLAERQPQVCRRATHKSEREVQLQGLSKC